eukprot:NODE_7417_length_780_cov_25.365297_g6807_i0.p1 GENE.NODE_7417_length_780_cov_25.365297_g6807_i0~~NODE_7417_length_780_cov_25.365297_g6807_i0.p1  ORF type:complete len:218 (-),score=45.28 NODE_7417_length_780_cov_25.365297_g6807_i0:125-778(-)
MNTIPDASSFGVNIRVPPGMSNDEVTTTVNSITGVSTGVSWYTTNGKPLVNESKSQFLVVPCNKFWESMQTGLTNAGITKKVVEIFPAGTDGKNIRKIGIPVIGFSPIINTEIRLHVDNEYLPAQVFLNGIETYTKLITAISNADPDADVPQPTLDQCPGDTDVYGRSKTPSDNKPKIPPVVWALVGVVVVIIIAFIVYRVLVYRRSRFLDLDRVSR